MRIKQMCYVALLVGMGTVGCVAWLHAAEFDNNTPYYEDDGWLDITEWFDGNDYNPTDETWWRWDDETYQAAQDMSSDRANDNWYGYTARDDNDWYYDYYDPDLYSYYDYDDNDLYEYGSRYYDYDNDGIYDAYASYSDWDGDGLYDDYDYFSFTDTSTDEQRKLAKDQVAHESRQQKVTGKIQRTKLVQVRGGKQHMVVAIQPQEQNGQKEQLLIVDLGRVDDLKDINPKLGDQITVQGPKAQVGKRNIVLAKSFDLNGKMKEVVRNPRSITGKVLSTHETKLRGKEHLLAMVETTQKEKSHKIAVDLGPADRLKMDIDKGSSLTFSGFPVKVQDKFLMMAQTVQMDDQAVQINRLPSKSGKQGQETTKQQ